MRVREIHNTNTHMQRTYAQTRAKQLTGIMGKGEENAFAYVVKNILAQNKRATQKTEDSQKSRATH